MQQSLRAKLTSALGIGILVALAPAAQATVQRVKYPSGNNYLIVEVLTDDLIHFEVSALGPGPDTSSRIVTTPQVFKIDYGGPSSFTQSGPAGNTLDTPDVKLVVDSGSLCFTPTDKTRNLVLTTICPLNLAQATKGLTLTPGTMQHVYGLGEQFIQQSANGDWTAGGHQQRTPGDNFGNQMIGFGGGADGNAQIPVMYAVGPNNANYALFLDQIYKQTWDFSGNPWSVQMWGDQIRGYLITGKDLPSLRQAYMDLTGHPPVPPKKMFGLWLSQYGFHEWGEIDGKLSNLRADRFPIDGFVLDLQWFGGVPATGTNPSRMGSLMFDTTHFPNPANKLDDYGNSQGIGIMAIEESYIDQSLAEFTDLKNRQFLVKLCRNGPGNSCNAAIDCPMCAPVVLGPDWFGTVGMVDWTNDAAADYWHDLKRQKLINMGLAGHWIDLGEPERYNPTDWVAGILPGKHTQADYHNLYNFKWGESIARGYTRNGVARRPFLMARSGAAGIQRFGASIWSGDIGSQLGNLAAHMNAQMHMSMSGIDYFGSDIGGFHREAVNSDLNDLYTRWFANGMMFDIPGRPHTDTHLCPYPVPNPPPGGCNETAPDRIGDLASNLANVRQRYELSPYLYSLAYRAYLSGEPVAPPLVYYYQNDANVRQMGDEKMLGRDVLVATVTAPGPPNPNGETQRDVYLPAGDWINYQTNQWFHSSGQTFAAQPEYVNGIFRLPAYARAGALIPKMFVDDKTMNALGLRMDGTTRNDLVTRVYASGVPTTFTVYEDDGQTTAYQSGAFSATPLSQQLATAPGTATETVTIGPASGTYTGAPSSRNNVIELVAENAEATSVTLNGSGLPQLASQAAFDAAASGWFNAGNNLILAKTGSQSVAAAKTMAFTLNIAAPLLVTFVCNNGVTTWGQSVYAVGNIPVLGNWAPGQAVKLSPNGPYPGWTGTNAVPPNTAIQWKCIKRPENADSPVVWQPGSNNAFTSPASGNVTTTGDFNAGGGTATEQFICDNGTTVWGQSVYVVGSIPALGNWDPTKAVKLDPTNYPRWTGAVSSLPANTAVEWKCVKQGVGAVVWQPDPNNSFTAPPAGQVGIAGGVF
jgi:alpha-glucosidase